MRGELPEHSALDHNLRQLLQRCYLPVRSREAFRTDLERTFLAAVGNRSKPGCADPGHAARRPGIAVLALAATALLAALLAGLVLLDSETELSLETILANEQVAVRWNPEDAWSAVEGDSEEPVATLEAPPVELVTPRSRGARLGLADGPELVLVEPRSHVLVTADGSAPLALSLEDGSLRAHRNRGPAWVLRTAQGTLELSAGQLHLAIATGAECARLELGAATAWLTTGSDRVLLDPHSSYLLRAGRILPAAPPGIAVRSLPPGSEPLNRRQVPADRPDDEEPAPVRAEAPVVSGRVVDAKNDEPIRRYEVVAIARQGIPEESPPRHSASSDDGRFRIAGLAPGEYELLFLAEGYAVQAIPLDLRADRPTTELCARLRRGSRVFGRVVDESNGAPIAGAVVISEADAPTRLLPTQLAPFATRFPGAVRSAADGSFTLENVAAGKQVLRACHPDFAPGWSRHLELLDEIPASGIEIRLRPGGGLQGRITDTAGAPIPGAPLLATLVDYEAARPCWTYSLTLADERGHYALPHLPPGFYAVMYFAGDAKSSEAPRRMVHAEVREGRTSTADLLGTTTGCSLRGQLLSAAGEPLANHTISVLPERDLSASWEAATTDAEGRFRFQNLQPGHYALFLSADAGASIQLHSTIAIAREEEREVELRLGRARLHGRVRHGITQRGLQAAVLVLYRRLEDRAGASFAGKLFSDREGRFEFAGLAAGQYRVTAFATSDDLGQESTAWIQVPESGQPTLDLLLFPGGAIEVALRDRRGRPVAGAELRFLDALGEEVRFAQFQRSDARGTFAARGCKAGWWTVHVQHRDFRPTSGRRVKVVPGTQTPLQIELESIH